MKDKENMGKGIIRLRFALPAFFTLFLVITGATIFSVNFIFSINSLESVAFEYLAQIGTTVVERTVNHLEPAAKMARINSRILNPLNFKDDFLHLFNTITIPQFYNYSQFALVYYGSEEGDFWLNGLDPDGTISTQTINRLVDDADSDKFLKDLQSQRESLSPKAFEDALVPYLHTSILYRDSAGDVIREETVPDYIYDPRWRPWYKNASENNTVSWTGGYQFTSSGRFYASGKTGVTVSSPVYHRDGNLAGVVGVDIFLEELTSFLKRLGISEKGRAFIVSPRGELIAFGNLALGNNSQPEVLSSLDNLSDLPAKTSFSILQKRFENIDDVISLNDAMQFRFETDDEQYLAYYAPVPEESGPPWMIGVIAPEDDFIGNLKNKLLITLFITIGVLFFMVFISILIGNKITLPIKNLMEDALLIKDLDLNYSTQIPSAFTEIADMNAAFQNMKVGLRSFKKYIPGDVVRYLIRSGNEAVLGGEEKTLTIFFSDVADFTAISEKLTPGILVSHLGDYLGEYSQIIQESKGTVDKYIGDAVMAFWNAPGDLPEHAYKACGAALKCIEKLGDLHHIWAEANLPILHTRIGIHTGNVIVGNMGSSERLNYTIIGDPVNLASRLESLAKVYGVAILVSEATRNLVEDSFLFRKIDRVIVLGKTIPVTIYELISTNRGGAPPIRKWVEIFEKGLDAYFAQNWSQAYGYFSESLEIHQGDKASLLYLNRIKYYKNNPPSSDWDGVARYKKK
ncbi:MAG: hypothetical protein JEY91_03785 [Spirochaetaceae bacterium]|nr:hypothetical protein [Spirochaetaceae bacterium]